MRTYRNLRDTYRENCINLDYNLLRNEKGIKTAADVVTRQRRSQHSVVFLIGFLDFVVCGEASFNNFDNPQCYIVILNYIFEHF